MDKPLAGRITLVAGATRGAGRGIALELAAAGAKVWCTGRSVTGAPATPGRLETIDETAEMIRASGGEATAVRVDHTVEVEVAALAHRLRDEEGRLDVLVNDIWGGDEAIDWRAKFWTLDMTSARAVVDQAIFSHLITSRHLAPIMVEAKRGLIVEVTDGHLPGYRGQLLYDFVKAPVIRLAYAMAWDLAGTGVTSLAISPGFLRSEAILEKLGVAAANWRDAIETNPEFAYSETPRYLGRAIAALAADPRVGRKSGLALFGADVAEEYGFNDLDGQRPHFWRNNIAWLADELAAEGDLSPRARFMGGALYAQIHRSPERRELAAQLADRLGLTRLPPGLAPS